MAKNSTLKKRQPQEMEEFDFSGMMMDSPDEEAMMGMMSGLIEASQNQMQIALELTRITVENNTPGTFNEKDVYSIFTRASKVAADNSPIKDLWEQVRQ